MFKVDKHGGIWVLLEDALYHWVARLPSLPYVTKTWKEMLEVEASADELVALGAEPNYQSLLEEASHE